jgi:pyruvate,water dikinase
MTEFILPLNSPSATLENVGGKGANLARLARAGYPVPGGFLIATSAYRAFVAANDFEQRLLERVRALQADKPEELEAASEEIRRWFDAGPLPGELAEAMRAAYAAMGQSAVAVRSSATAEDLPDMSFAGQQDTYLNIVGEEALLKAVVSCWGSLWTARAIGYRARNGIPPEGVALAVVVQAMVMSEASGVLFTANPLTGARAETVIDATLGLGEALVSGQVEPDHYVVETASGKILSKTLGAKATIIRGQEGGGVQVLRVPVAPLQGSAKGAEKTPALTDEAIGALTTLGSRVASEYNFPQDIEWAVTNGELFLLQARPITSLFPLPEASPDSFTIWFSFGAVQGVLGPVTPMGSDAFRSVAIGAGQMFGVHLGYDEQTAMVPAGERLWIKISDVIRHPLGQRLFGMFLGFVEPSVEQILRGLASEPRLGAGQGKFTFTTARRLARFALPILGRMAGTMLNPQRARADFDALIEQGLRSAHAQRAPTGDIHARLAQRLDFMQARMAATFPALLPRFISLFGPNMMMLNLLTRLTTEHAETDHGFSMLALEVTRGLPNNVTTEMDLALWKTATAIRADAASLAYFGETDAPALAARYLSGTLPPAAQDAIAEFMTRYGMRGVAEIDIGVPRWREKPAPIMQTLQSYLRITDANAAPDVVFARGAQTAAEAIEKLAAAARRQRGGWLKEKLVRFAARRVRILLGVRESPKFYAVRVIGIVREQLLASGADFVAAGLLDRPDDLAFLHLPELEALARGEQRDWKTLVAERRATYAREERRRQIPRVLVSDGRTYYEGLGASTNTGNVISGSPVSAGVVEGIVHVIFDPHGAQLAPGEILVCPGTDPAWTPLFLAAGGLVMEVGGMMTHGSVVAREYGIPAVVGVDRATEVLKTGQRIRVDGSAGRIEILEGHS